MISLLTFLQFCSVFNAKYILLTLKKRNDPKLSIRLNNQIGNHYENSERISPSSNILGTLEHITGYRKLPTKEADNQEWEKFFQDHGLCSESSLKCNYLDRCSPSNENQDPCKNVRMGSWKGNKNISCAKPHEIRPCHKANKFECGPIYYYFTKCNESDSKDGVVCLCLDEAVIRKESLKPTDECTMTSNCQYADFCSPQNGTDPCDKMDAVFVPNPKSSSKKYQPVLKIPMKCVSLTTNKISDFHSPSCKNNTDICSCQDSGLE